VRPRQRTPALLCLLTLLAAAPAAAQTAKTATDTLLAAMTAELERSKELRLVSLDDAYFIEYSVDDAEFLTITATLGALVSKSQTRLRAPRIQVRVGGYDFDNTNYVFSDFFTGRGGRIGQAPLDNDLIALRSYFWLATDRAYKGALTAIARKRAALKNVSQPQPLPDFSRAEPVVQVLKTAKLNLDDAAWTDTVRELSAVFSKYPEITRSSVSFSAIHSNTYLANSEGTVVRYPESVNFVQIRGEGQSADGMALRNARVIQRLDATQMPTGPDLARSAEEVAEQLAALLEAPMGESYVGPVLFEGMASGQLFAQLLGNNVAIQRRPVAEPGRPVPFLSSEFEGRIGARVLPDWMNVVDDPLQSEWRGQPLLGTYGVDIEGLRPEPLALVESGVLKSFLLTRQPIKGFSESNARARLPGQYGANSAHISNLFVQAKETVTEEDLKKRLIGICEQRGKEYGIIIRRLDFPSSASMAELRRQSNSARQSGGGGRLMSSPILAYKLYLDGREELIRGLQFRGLTARALRDIIAASDQEHLFNFLGSNAPLSLLGAGGFVTASSVISPSVLVEDIELDQNTAELQKPPIVPPPDLIASP